MVTNIQKLLVLLLILTSKLAVSAPCDTGDINESCTQFSYLDGKVVADPAKVPMSSHIFIYPKVDPVDSKIKLFIKDTNGNVSSAGGTTVIDNLTSPSAVFALSANQGRILDGKISDAVSDITDNTTAIGNIEDELITINSDILVIESDITDIQGDIIEIQGDIATIPQVQVIDALNSTSTISALSANQGRILNVTKGDVWGPIPTASLQLVKINPNMTSNTTPTGYTITGSPAGGSYYRSFDGVTTTDYYAGVPPVFVVVQIPVAKAIKQYRVWTAGDGGTKWTFSGSTNGTTWTVINNVVGATQNDWYVYNLPSVPPAYSYFKLEYPGDQTDGGYGNGDLYELEIYAEEMVTPTIANKYAAFTDATGKYLKAVDVPMIGPQASRNNHFAIWDGLSGKVLKDDSDIALDLWNIYLPAPGSFVVNTTPQQSFFNYSALGWSPNNFRFILAASQSLTADYTLTFPAVPPVANQVLRSDATGQLSWIAMGTGGGDVVGPASSVVNQVALFNSVSGKLIKNTTYTIPAVDGLNNQILKTNGAGVVSWATDAGGGTGDVVGPAVAVADNLASYSGTTGKLIKDSGITTASITTIQTNSHTHANKALLDTLKTTGPATQYLSALGTYTTPVDTNDITIVVDALNSTSTTAALSANQGRILDGKITPLTAASHTHANKGALDKVTDAGGGTTFLANDGNYKVPIDTNTITTVIDALNSTSTTSALSANQGRVLNEKVPLTTWAVGQAYKVGEIKNSGDNNNWLFKVTQDHTSTNVPADFRAGKILAISPPIITTGLQAGGQATLNAPTRVATVQAGTGYIALYGPAPTAFPQITIVEWGTQTVTLPNSPPNIFTLFINSTGVLEYVSGTGATTQAEQDTKISVGIVDMNLGVAYDRETYPTNPVGQLRGLSFFFGGMTKGLSYSAVPATPLTMARTAHDVYYWGANTSDQYNPNTKSVLAISPVPFFEYYQGGPVVPTTRKTVFNTSVWDDGTNDLAVLSNNKWGFVRIYSAPGVDDYIMYAQAEYADEAAAKAAAISTNFIKPVDLTLTKFSAWFVFQKDDLDLTNNLVTVCEPFGCDKIGTSAGGVAGGGGAGDVLGPAGGTFDGEISVFADSTGKVIKSSGIDSDSLFVANGVVPTANKVMLFAGGGATGLGLQTSDYTFPDSSCPNGQILKSDGTNFTCQDDFGGAATVVIDALNSTSTTAALSANQGRILDGKITPLTAATHSHTNKSQLDAITTGGSTTMFLSAFGDYRTPVDTNTVTVVEDLLTSNSATNALSANQGRVLDGKIASNTSAIATHTTNITALQGQTHTHANKGTLDNIKTNGTTTEYLSGTGQYVTLPAASTGDVVGPGTANDSNLASFNTGTGKLIKDSGIPSAIVATKAANFSAANRVVLAYNGLSKALAETGYTIPQTVGSNGQVLQVSGSNLVFATPATSTATGDVSGPAGSEDGSVAMFSGTGGKTLKTYSGFTYATGYLTLGPAAGGMSGVKFNSGGVGTVTLASSGSNNSNYTLNLPTSAPGNSQILLANSSGQLSWVALPVDTNSITVVEDLLTSTSAVNALSANQGRLLNVDITALEATTHSHANKTVLDAVPSTMCTTGQILKSVGATFTCQADSGGAGDVAGPAGGTYDGEVAVYSSTTGKAIKSGGIDSNSLFVANGVDGLANRVMLYAGGTAKGIGLGTSSYTFPPTSCSNGQILKSDGTNFNCSSDAGGVAQPAVKANLIFDFNEGVNQVSSSNCGSVQLNNTVDGGVYSIVLTGTTSAQCSFSGTPTFTTHLPVGHGSTVGSKHTLYTFTRLNGHIYIGWNPGL